MLGPLTLLLVLQVVDARSKEEPDAMREEKVHFAGIIKNVTDLLNLGSIKFGVQVEAAQLGNEEL